MKFYFYFLIVAFSYSNLAISQCTPNYNFFPLFSNFGLSPDSLPSGTVFQEYNQDLTFVLPVDTLYDVPNFGETLITFEDYHIQSISLPPGLEWECNNSENDCHYNPSDSQYGCVKLTGTPMLAGLYSVDVVVEATHELSSLAGTEMIVFSLPLFIEPSLSQNDGFIMTNFSGCAPLNVDFESIYSDWAIYSWDFGNGTSSDLIDPGTQTFNQAGIFPIYFESMSVASSQYFLESVEIENASDWGNEWFDEDLLTNPDPYFVIVDSQGNQIFESEHYEDQDFPVSWNLNEFLLSDQEYSIQAWEEDGISTNDDYLGTVYFDGISNSTTLTSGNLIINIVISEIDPIVLTAYDTVFVYDYPSVPILNYDESSNLLYVDSEIEDLSFQWYFNQEPLVGENTSTMEVVESGDYMIEFVNYYGCNTFSVDTFIVFCDNDYSPQVSIDGSLLSVDNFLEYNCQWFFNGMELSGENQDQLIATQSGEYSILLFDEQGCEYKSQDVNIDLSTILELSGINIILYPNPANSYVELSLDNINSSDVLISIFDLQGRNVFTDLFSSSKFQIDISSLQKGTYIVNVQIESVRKSMRLLVN